MAVVSGAVTGRLKAIGPLTLILFPLLFMICVGGVVNSLSGSGITNSSPNFAGCSTLVNDSWDSPCPAYNGSPNPCDTPSNCEINNTISFLNKASPFTILLRGDFIGFANSIFITANQSAINQLGTGIVNGSIFAGCSNKTETYYTCTAQIPYGVFALNVSLSFTSKIVTNGSALDCTTGICHSESGLLIQQSQNRYSTYNNYIATCTINYPLGIQFFCTQIQSATDINTGGANTLLSVLGFVGGLILTIISLGLYFSGTFLTFGASIGINAQGTKMAQMFGIGLLVYSFIASEFATPFFALGLGAGIVLTAVFALSFFAGLWLMLPSGDSGGTGGGASV